MLPTPVSWERKRAKENKWRPSLLLPAEGLLDSTTTKTKWKAPGINLECLKLKRNLLQAKQTQVLPMTPLASFRQTVPLRPLTEGHWGYSQGLSFPETCINKVCVCVCHLGRRQTLCKKEQALHGKGTLSGTCEGRRWLSGWDTGHREPGVLASEFPRVSFGAFSVNRGQRPSLG